MKCFGSDNFSGVHPDIIKAMVEANEGHAFAYGADQYTASVEKKFKEHFGDVDVYLVMTGTGANVLSLAAITEPFNAVICPETAHINTNECGAPEKFTGCKLLPVPTEDGKLRIHDIESRLVGIGDAHHVQPVVVSISQSTELGTVYTVDELKELSNFVHKKGMFLHMDGARLSNAVAYLGVGFKEITADVGIDVLSFGGTKNGMMIGEAVVFFNKDLSRNFEFVRMQGMQLFSKMRFLAVQFEAFLSNGLYLKNALNANRMAKLLAEELAKIPQIRIAQKVEANAVFAFIPADVVTGLQGKYFFHIIDEKTSFARLMCSFDTTEEDIYGFVSLLKELLNRS